MHYLCIPLLISYYDDIVVVDVDSGAKLFTTKTIGAPTGTKAASVITRFCQLTSTVYIPVCCNRQFTNSK